MKPTKQIILFRKDLNLDSVRLAHAMCSASFNALYAEMPTTYGAEGYMYSTLDYREDSALAKWLDEGQTLQSLYVADEVELLNLTTKLAEFTPYVFTRGDATDSICSAIGPVFNHEVDHLLSDLEEV